LQAKVIETSPNTTPLVSLKVMLSNNSFIEIGSFFVEPTTIVNNATNPTTHKDYTFVFDVSRIVQDYYIFNGLPDVFAAKTETNAIKVLTGWIEDLTGGTVAFELDSDGLIESGGFFGLSSFGVKALNATAQHTEDFTLSDYIHIEGSGTPSKTSTKANRVHELTESESIFIGSLYDGASYGDDIHLISYDKNGSPLNAGVVLGANTVGDAGYSINAGFDSLINKTFLAANPYGVSVFAGPPDFLSVTDPIKAIKIAYGKATLNGTTGLYDFVFNTEQADIKYIDCANDRSFRLHWINELGFIDSYTFSSVNTKEIKTKSKAGKTGLVYDGSSGTPHNVNIGGSYKYQSTGQISHKLKSKHLDNANLDWLKYLLVTPHVWAEIDGNFIPVRIV
jgi:hypothetical protein